MWPAALLNHPRIRYWIKKEGRKEVESILNEHVSKGESSDQAVEDAIESARIDESEVINVWHGTGENAELSNLALRPFSYTHSRHKLFFFFPDVAYQDIPEGQEFDEPQEKEYFSVEHAYQTLKSGFFDEATYGKKEWEKGGVKIVGGKVADRAKNKGIMFELMMASFEQNPDAKNKLLATGNAKITHTGDKGIWRDLFPEYLMRIRAELRGTEGVSAPTFVNTDAKGNRLDSKGKGTSAGDGKDKEMRRIANAFIGEISSRRPSSTLTSAKVIAEKHEGYEAVVSEKGKISKIHDVAVHPPTLTGEITIMLARNGKLKGKPLSEITKSKIESFARDAKFVVGDMPGVDQPFIDLLQELGADFTVYGTGNESRIGASASLTSVWFRGTGERGRSGKEEGGLIPLTKDERVATEYALGGSLSGMEYEEYEEFVQTPRYAEAQSRVKAYQPRISKTLDLRRMDEKRDPLFGEIDAHKILAGLDDRGDQDLRVGAASIIDASKRIIDGDSSHYWWEYTRPEFRAAWKNILIPQLEELGYDSIRYHDDISTGDVIAVFSEDQLVEDDKGEQSEVSASLSSMEEILTHDDPFFGQGWDNAHKEMIEANRRLQSHIAKSADRWNQLESRVGLRRLYDSETDEVISITKDEKAALFDYLSLVSARMEKKPDIGWVVVTNSIPVEDLPDGEEKEELLDKDVPFKVIYKTRGEILNAITPALKQKLSRAKGHEGKEQFDLGIFDDAALAQEIRVWFEEQREEENLLAARMDPDEWIPHLDNYLTHIYRNRSKEDGDRIKQYFRDNPAPVHERLHESYYTAALENGLVPKTMNPGELLTERAQLVGEQWLRRHMTAVMLMMRDATGHPIMLVDLNLKAKGRHNRLVSDDVLLASAHHLASILGLEVSSEKGIREEYERLKTEYLTNHPEAFKKPIESPFTRLSGDDDGSKPRDPPGGSTLRFYVQDGPANKIARQFLDRKWEGKVLGVIQGFNTISKYMGLAVSFFHPFALMESYSGASGVTLKNPALIWNWNKARKDWWALRNAVKKGERTYIKPSTGEVLTTHALEWVDAGMQLDMRRSLDADTQLNQFDDLLARGVNWTVKKSGGENNPYGSKVRKAGDSILKAKSWWDKMLWEEMHPMMKIHAANSIFISREGYNLNAKDQKLLRENISRYINDAFGGQEWTRYVWATPKAKQVMHLMIFAPDWSISAMQVAGMGHIGGRVGRVPGIPFMKEYMKDHLPSNVQNDEMLSKYWPAMFTIVLAGIPNAIQSVIWGAAHAFGIDDEDDKPFTFLNETGKRTHIDITPAVRWLDWVPGIGYEGLPSKKRRVYIRWGKQAYEVLDYFTDPVERVLTKTASFPRTVFEQITGTTVTGWELPFKDEGFSGLFSVDEGLRGKFDSRIGFVFKKFVPFSILGFLEQQPSGFFAPASRGVSQSRATRDLALILKVYSDDATMKEVDRSERKKTNLESLGHHIVEGAVRNGYDPEIIINSAKSYVLRELYSDYFSYLNDKKYSKMRKTSARILRVNGTVDGLTRSMTRRYKQAGRELSPEELLLIEKSMASRDEKFEYGKITPAK